MSHAVTAKALTGHWERDGSGADLDVTAVEPLVVAGIVAVLLVALIVRHLDRRWATAPNEQTTIPG